MRERASEASIRARLRGALEENQPRAGREHDAARRAGARARPRARA
jgi:hypothetical protein